MRRVLAVAVIGLAALTAVPASAGPDLVHVRNDADGVGVGIGPEAHPIVAVGVDYDGRVCVTIGFSSNCVPE